MSVLCGLKLFFNWKLNIFNQLKISLWWTAESTSKTAVHRVKIHAYRTSWSKHDRNVEFSSKTDKEFCSSSLSKSATLHLDVVDNVSGLWQSWLQTFVDNIDGAIEILCISYGKCYYFRQLRLDKSIRGYLQKLKNIKSSELSKYFALLN